MDLPNELIYTAVTYLNTGALNRCQRVATRWQDMGRLVKRPNNAEVIYNILDCGGEPDMSPLIERVTSLMKGIIRPVTWHVLINKIHVYVMGWVDAYSRSGCNRPLRNALMIVGTHNTASERSWLQRPKSSHQPRVGLDGRPHLVGGLPRILPSRIHYYVDLFTNVKAHHIAMCIMLASIDHKFLKRFQKLTEDILDYPSPKTKDDRKRAKAKRRSLEKRYFNPWIMQYMQLFYDDSF